jgi:sulfoxide reductase heme-binding subunit YedZ
MTPFTDRKGRFSPFKTSTFAALLAPAFLMSWSFATGAYGPLPFDELIRDLGSWALRLVMLTLALTPAQRVFAWPALSLIRRMVGVSAFAYALAHLAVFWIRARYDLVFVASEIALRIYLTVGFVAFAGLLALAATSTDSIIRRLGAKWKQLHRAIYVIAALGVLHFFMQAKIDVSEAVLMAGLYLLLMAYRVVIAWRRPLTGFAMSVCAVLAAILAAMLEALWYGLTSGIDPWRVLAVNASVQLGLRPAISILVVGLVAASLPLGARLLLKRQPMMRPRTA